MKKILSVAAVAMAAMLVTGCANKPVDQVAEVVNKYWSVVPEPSLIRSSAAKAELAPAPAPAAVPVAESTAMASAQTYVQIPAQVHATQTFAPTSAQTSAQIDFAAGSVSLGAGAENREPIKSIAASIIAADATALITGYATTDNGEARARATANYRAQSVYYKLAYAGVPKSSMQMATETVPAGTGADGRKVTVSW